MASIDEPWDHLWLGAHCATMDPNRQGLGIIEDAAIATRGDRIVWVGTRDQKTEIETGQAKEITELKDGWILPAFIDCHTHLVFAGDRRGEFQMRLEGRSYEEISRAGGGIVSTVKATRAASEEELIRQSLPRLRALRREGATTIEIKSGYGLNLETELKMLRAAKTLGKTESVKIEATFLGAHAVPEEFGGRSDDYIESVCSEMIPEVAKQGLASAVDGFCEGIAFTPQQIERVFETALGHGMRVKLHADQLSDLGGASLAARYGALSADHLEHTSTAGVEAMAKAGTTAVLLPGAFYFLQESQKPPLDALREFGVPLALATDCNPGSSPITSLRSILHLACTMFGLTPDEALLGVTRNAATALGKSDERGSIVSGALADFSHWPISHPADLCYWLSSPGPDLVVASGVSKAA